MVSVLVDPPSPDQLHSNFSQAANSAAQAVQRFTHVVEDSRIREVMEKAKESRTKNGEGITGWKVTDHEDWLDVKHEDGNEDADKEGETIAEAGDSPSMEDVNGALDKFRSAHVGVEALLDDDSRTVTVIGLHGFVRLILKRARSIYLCRPKLTSRSSSMLPSKATVLTSLTAKTSQSFTEQFLR